MARTPDRRGLLAGAGALALAGCYRRETPQADAQPLDLHLSDLEGRHGGRLGVAALDVASGRQALWRAQERFPFCSTFKAFLAAATLQRVQRGEEDLERRVRITRADMIPHAPTTGPAVGRDLSIRQLMQAAVELSDNPAANILIREMGGIGVWRQWWPSFGDTTTLISRLEPEQNTARTVTLKDPRVGVPSFQKNWLVPSYTSAVREKLDGEPEALDLLSERDDDLREVPVDGS